MADSKSTRPRGAKRSAAFSWKGGRTINHAGYVLLYRPEHPDATKSGYVREHRVVAEETLGRRLLKTEIVHHINGVKSDNRPENLEVLPSIAEHRAKHRTGRNVLKAPGEANLMIHCACGCGTLIQKYASNHVRRHFVSGHNRRAVASR